ncbi:MAG: hypothetical protein OEY00_00995 [Gammaproteobacteria bacterium]|nr:hypothetical protein [Gammaproteobacteria bacterium]
MKTLLLLVVLLITSCSSGNGNNEQGNDQLLNTRCDRSNLTLEFPFNYTLNDDSILIHTDGGDIATTTIPWGAHVQPYTGHPEGNAKSGWVGLFATDYAQLTELENSGVIPGVCEQGDVCGLPLSSITSRIVNYVMSWDGFKVTEVRLGQIVPIDTVFGNQDWLVNGEVCGYRYRFGHTQKISKTLRDKMVAAGYTDPYSLTTASDNLITGDPIILNKGDEVAEPRIQMLEVPGHPGYFKGVNAVEAVPWLQAEFDINDSYLSEDEGWSVHPIFRLFPQAIQDQLYNIMAYEYLKPDSFHFKQSWVQPWLANAEFVLYTELNMHFDDYSSIYSALGGWWERSDQPCTPYDNVKCDQMFSIFKIHKDTIAYDDSLYYSPDINYLVALSGTPVLSGTMFGEVLSPLDPDPISGVLTVRWRRFLNFYYQGIAYRLDSAKKQLKIRWSDEVTDILDVVLPSVPNDSDSCDGVSITCQSHVGYHGGTGGP